MARRKRRYTRKRSTSKKRSYRKYYSSKVKLQDIALAGSAYAFGRGMVANMIPDFPQVSEMTQGVVSSDNLIVSAVSYYGLKNKSKFVKNLSMITLANEIGMVASQLINKPKITQQSAYKYTY